MLSETCTYPDCGQEVRHGVRDGASGWWHREAVDHNPMFGVVSSPEQRLPSDGGEDAAREEFVVPEPEVSATPVAYDDERVPIGARIVLKKCNDNGVRWTASYSRGPRLHSSRDEVLGISDCILVRMLDEDGTSAVACWWTKSKGYELEFAYVGKESARPVNSNELRAWIEKKENDTDD
jgi:hypothetical protein